MLAVHKTLPSFLLNKEHSRCCFLRRNIQTARLSVFNRDEHVVQDPQSDDGKLYVQDVAQDRSFPHSSISSDNFAPLLILHLCEKKLRSLEVVFIPLTRWQFGTRTEITCCCCWFADFYGTTALSGHLIRDNCAMCDVKMNQKGLTSRMQYFPEAKQFWTKRYSRWKLRTYSEVGFISSNSGVRHGSKSRRRTSWSTGVRERPRNTQSWTNSLPTDSVLTATETTAAAANLPRLLGYLFMGFQQMKLFHWVINEQSCHVRLPKRPRRLERPSCPLSLIRGFSFSASHQKESYSHTASSTGPPFQPVFSGDVNGNKIYLETK